MSTTPPVPALPFASLPAQFYAGDTLAAAVQTQLPSGSTVAFYLAAIIANVPTGISLPSQVVDADGVATFTCIPAVTRLWGPARYAWTCIGVDLAGNRAVLASGEIRILPDPAAGPADTRTRNERILANIRAVQLGNSLSDVQMYKIGTREITKMSRKDLDYQEAIYESRVRRERIARGEKVPSRTVGISFGGSR